MHDRALLTLLAIATLLPPARAADWTFFRGPTQNGMSGEKLTLPAGELPLLWKTNAGIGASSIVVSGDRAITMGNVQGKDVVRCFETATGNERWKYEYPLAIDARMFEGGTLSTPTIDGDLVYTVSHQGDFFCLHATTGQAVWYKHYQRDFQGKRPDWGYAGSPLIEGNLLILDVGGSDASTVALDKTTGQTVWKSGDDGAGYATPIAVDLAGQRTLVLFKAGHVVGLEAKTGRELWRQKWKTEGKINAATPLVFDQRLFISSGYERGCALFDITSGGATQRWENKNLKAHITAPVFWQGAIYGLSGQASPRGTLVCLDPETGALKWAEKVGGGSLVLADGKLVVLSELGELIIADAVPTGFKAALRQQVLGTRCWAPPTIAHGRIFCRNNNGDIAVHGLQAPAQP